MFQKIREKIKTFNFKKYAKFLPLFLILIVIGLALPRSFVHASTLGWIVSEIIYIPVYAIFFVLFFIAHMIAIFAAYTLDVFLNPAIMNNVFANQAIYDGWKIIRDVCNLLFLLLLLLIAFGTIIQNSKYNIKNSLLKLILAIFLINFSYPIAGAIIDFGNILMYGILGWMCESSNGADTCFTSFFGIVNSGQTNGLLAAVNGFSVKYSLANSLKLDGISAETAIGIVVATIYTFMLAFILLAIAAFLLVRTAALAFLLVLAPLAYFGEVMPGMESLSKKWWDNIWSYTLFGPIFALMLYISGEMSRVTIKAPEFAYPHSEFGVYGGMLTVIVENILPLFFLLAIIPITKSLGMAGTDAIMKNVDGMRNFATGTASDTWGRFIARGAADTGRGWNWGGLRGGIRRGLSNLSPTAIKQAYKAKQANDAHDYDVATGRVRNKMEDLAHPYDAAKEKFNKTKNFISGKGYKDDNDRPDYQQEAQDKKDSEGWKNKGIDDVDRAREELEKGRKNGTMTEGEMKIAVKFIATNGGIEDMLKRSTYKDANGAEKVFESGPEGLLDYVDKTFKGMSEEDKSKLLANIAKSEDKNGNTAYNGLGVSDYNASTKRVEYRVNDMLADPNGIYTDPATGNPTTKINQATNLPYTKKEWQEEQQVKAANKKDPKDIKKSSFIASNNEVHTAGERILQDVGEGKRAERIKTMDRDRVQSIHEGLKKKYARILGTNPNNLFMTDPNNPANKIVNPTWNIPTKTIKVWNKIIEDHHLS